MNLYSLLTVWLWLGLGWLFPSLQQGPWPPR